MPNTENIPAYNNCVYVTERNKNSVKNMTGTLFIPKNL